MEPVSATESGSEAPRSVDEASHWSHASRSVLSLSAAGVAVGSGGTCTRATSPTPTRPASGCPFGRNVAPRNVLSRMEPDSGSDGCRVGEECEEGRSASEDGRESVGPTPPAAVEVPSAAPPRGATDDRVRLLEAPLGAPLPVSPSTCLGRSEAVEGGEAKLLGAREGMETRGSFPASPSLTDAAAAMGWRGWSAGWVEREEGSVSLDVGGRCSFVWGGERHRRHRGHT